MLAPEVWQLTENDFPSIVISGVATCSPSPRDNTVIDWMITPALGVKPTVPSLVTVNS